MRVTTALAFAAASRILGRPGRCPHLIGHANHLEITSEDPFVAAISRVQPEAPEKIVRFSANPTVEVLAREAWHAIRQSLPAGVALQRVLIRETPTCSSALSRDCG